MSDTEVVQVVRGTITTVYGDPVSPEAINIIPDDPKYGKAFYIGEYFREKFEVGQRVVWVQYRWKRPLREDEKWEFPGDEYVNQYRHETYKEQAYDRWLELQKELDTNKKGERAQPDDQTKNKGPVYEKTKKMNETRKGCQ